MNKQSYKELRRQCRIAARMTEELYIDLVIYGSSFQLRNECGIFNIPPNEILRDEKGEIHIIIGDKVERVVK